MVKNTNKFVGYLKTPIGGLEVVCSDKYLLELNFSEEFLANENKNFLVEKTLLELQEYFSGERKKFEIPFVLEGSDFQKKAWAELLNIPYGQTVSYSQQALNIGSPNACRAVGGANNKNKLPIIVPCHRVVGKKSDLIGYAGGLERKRLLLEHEREFVS